MKTKFKQDDLIFIRRLGKMTPGQYRGKICGISYTFDNVDFYIIEQHDKILGQTEWSHIVCISSCVDGPTPEEREIYWDEDGNPKLMYMD